MKPRKHLEEPTGRMVNNHVHCEFHYDDPAVNTATTGDDPAAPLPAAAGAECSSWTGPTGITYYGEEHPPAAAAPYQPVALRARKDGWTAARQRLFIETLAATGSITRASQVVDLSPRAVYRLRNHPKGGAFARAMDAAQMMATKRLIGVAFERATTGTSRQVWRQGRIVAETGKPSDRMLMWLLRHLSPDLFGPQADLAQRMARIAALQADFADAVAALTDAEADADAHDVGGRYPALPPMERI